MRRLFPLALVAATIATLAFLVVPIAAIFLRVPPGKLVDALGSEVARDALVVTLQTTVVAQLLIIAFGTPTAYLLATRRFPGHSLAVTLVELPLVLPPAVAGIGLLATFGRLGLLGSSLSALGIEIAFTKVAVVLAVMFVAGPFYIRTARGGVRGVDPTLTDAARTLGAGPARTFGRVALPLAAQRSRCRRCAFVRAWDRRVRRHDHVRRLPPGCHPDLVPGRLRAVRRLLRHRSRDRCRARRRQCGRSPRRQAGSLMASLHIDLSHGLRDIRLELRLEVASETVALVGPSGAGKSSVLRAIAGLLRPERGRIAVDGEVWLDTATGVDTPPESRSVGLVFQEYALFPHLSVRENVSFGARAADVVDEVMGRLRMAGLADERPGRLSGGERQRVALARAIAREPLVLLLDEPLSALDAHTRDAVRGELRDLLAALRLPTVLVTHDFEDAAALADRVGVLVDGRLLQVGTASQLVAAPADPFVARFTGATLLHGVAEPGPDGLTRVALDVGGAAWTTDIGTGRVAIAIHPWEVSVSRTAPDDSTLNHISAPIDSLVTIGNRVRVRVGPLAGEITGGSADRLGLQEGDVVVASFKATAARLIQLA